MRRLLLLLGFCGVAIAAARTQQSDTLVMVVRHAEKAGPTGDVALSAPGEERARALLVVARDAGVSAVITTQFQRTRQTGAPVAQALGVTPDVVAAAADVKEHARQIAALVRERYLGRTVLVVGHSNTVPAIIAALGGPTMRDLCDSEYDRLFVLSLAEGSSARLVQSRYGAPSPSDSTCPAMR
jgi:broad specificity phosphatase PhoE